jgi:hypothetical protein
VEPFVLSPRRREGRDGVRDQSSPKENRYGKKHEKKDKHQIDIQRKDITQISEYQNRLRCKEERSR